MSSIITNKYFKFILVTILVMLIVAIFGENIVFVIDFPSLIFLFVGTILLTLIGYKKGTPREKIFDNIKRNCIITGFVGFFAGFLMALCTTEGLENLPVNIAISMLIIPYTFFLYLAINVYKSKTIDTIPNIAPSTKNIESKPQTNWDDICNQYCLTEREKLVVEKLIQGASNKEIAEKLFVTENTIKKQISGIYKKTGVKSRYELICMLRDLT